MEKYQRTYAKIKLQAIKNNIDEVKKTLEENVKLMVVIKADGYGHGASIIGDFLKDKVDYFGVATIEEAIELRKSQIDVPVLILGYTSKEQYLDLINYDITQTIYNLKMAQELSRCAVECNKKVKIHIALETGMHRIGFDVNEESIKDVKKISKMDNLIMEGVFTHFSCADEKDKSYSLMQLEKYTEFLNMLEQSDIDIPIKHICNSAGIIEFNNKQFNMVRSGIITYGLYPSEAVNKEYFKLQPALEWKSRVINVFEVGGNRGVSYGKTFVTQGKTKIATVSIGYADGYMRSLSSKGRVLIHGEYAPIIGRICMDQMMIDVTHIKDVQIEDEVTLVGKDSEKMITIEEVAKVAGSFNYEFACGIGKRVKRIYEF